MRVKSILNNSALIAFSEKSEECVLIGKGIAFNKRPGDPVDETKAEKVFNSRHARTEELIELLEDVPEKVFEMTNTIIRYANRKLGKDLDSGIYVTLLDHIHSAIERTAEGIELDFGMLTEVRMLYPKEYNIACWALDYINATMDIDIPIDESGFIVIHIIANETPNMDTGSTKKILRITKDITDKALTMLDVDHEGLDYIDQKILRTMIEVYNGGPVGLGTLSVNIAEERDTVEDMYEPYLIQKGFIMRTRTGRVATAKAYDHLGYSYAEK